MNPALFDESWLPWLDLWGRLHPLLVHVPLGVLPVLVLLELWGGVRRKALDHGVRRGLISMAALAGAAAAVGGWLLAEEPAYGGADLELHRKLGVGLAGVSLLAMLAAWTGVLKVYGWALALAVGLLLPAGHLGGSMVHGDDFVRGPLLSAWEGERYVPPVRGGGRAGGAGGLPVGAAGVAGVPVGGAGASASAGAAGDPDGDPRADGDAAADVSAGLAAGATTDPEGVYARRVAPILETYCAACHGADKQRGYLALHTPAGILAGGEFGPALVPGDAAASELLRRLRLPLQGEAHMPPEGKPQPGAAELALLAAWIDAGAPFTGDAILAGVEVGGGGVAVVRSGAAGPVGSDAASDAEAGPHDPAPVAADPAAVQRLREALVHVEVIDPAGGLLFVGFAARPQGSAAELAELLAPLAGAVGELSLAGTGLGDEALATVATLSRLRALDLRGTAVGSAGLAQLAGLARLERLNLTGSAVDDDAVDVLAGLPSLADLHAWDTGLSAEGLARLAELRPGLRIEDGRSAPVEPLEVEPEVVFVKAGDTPPPGAVDLTPVNSVCPVSGGPVDARFAVVHEGRVIGFCCNKCPSTFWADPAAYPVE